MAKWEYQNKSCYLENCVARELCKQRTACNHNNITIKVIHHRLDKEQWLLFIRQSRVRFIDFRSYFTGVKEIVNTRSSKEMHLIAIN